MGDAGSSLRHSRRIIPKSTSIPRVDSPTFSTFSASQILPEGKSPTEARLPGFETPPDLPMSSRAASRSVSPPSVFDANEEQPENYTDPTALNSGSDDAPGSYDLKPPPPSVSQSNIEALSGRFFSADHLNIILRDPTHSSRFTKFLNQYKPHSTPTLVNYIETQKAIAAVEYANAIADRIPTSSGHPPYTAASIDDRFEARVQRASESLVNDALPAFVTHKLVHLVTDTLVKEITGNNSPLMREMIPSLAEVYCITDPSLPDNPIVYASEEFYNTSQYGREYVIGRNCRFLQGPKTVGASIKRLAEALAAGQEITETVLNYRRDGTPFMNLLMIAPLYDNKGHVRYFLGCQIDVSGLIEGGRGLESFAELLAQDRSHSRFGGRLDKDPKTALSDLSPLFSEEEVDIVKQRSRRYSQESGRSSVPMAVRGGRRRLGVEDAASDRALWPDSKLGPSGRLPGVYQNYLLVRPYPSLRITFTSPALRIPGLLQTKFLDRIGGPQNVREGILDSLAHGTSVTAKISWLTSSTSANDERASASFEGKPRWIHCTPMMGSDEKVGVWMIVMVESEEVTGGLTRGSISERGRPGSPQGAASTRFTGNKLYEEYLRREGKESMRSPAPVSLPSRSSTGRRTVDHDFRDF